MKQKYYIFFLTLFLIGGLLSMSQAQSIEIKAEIIHGQAFTAPTLSFAEGSLYNIGKIELKGRWEGSTEPTPTQAWNWFQDTNDDCPQAVLDWTNVTMDTTWIDNGNGTYSILQDLKNIFANGSWTDLNMNAGWLSTDSVYTVELQSVVGGVATTIDAYTFDVNGTNEFSAAELKIKYQGTKDGSGLTLGKAETMLKFENSSGTFSVPNNIEFLRVNWMNQAGTFYTLDFPVNLISASEMGLNIAAVVENTPGSGFFSAGDTIAVNVTFTNDGETELLWNEGASNGLEKFEFYLSGPKQNYVTIYEKVKVINKYILQNDPATGQPYTNPIRLALPAELPGTGTYTFLIKAKRIFGTTIEKYELVDMQVGTANVTQLPVANCESCHNGQYELTRHNAVGVEQCLVCHVDNMAVPFSKIAHEEHMVSPYFHADLGSCTTCHVNDTENQFTAYADQVCTACHNPVPYLPKDHSAVPLYAESNMSCATFNCHASGGVGVFKTIKETHAGLADKYVGGTLTAKGTLIAPEIDGVVESLWDDAPVITTLKGVELRAMYDDANLYLLAKWTDGHNLYSGAAGPTESIDNKLWTFVNNVWVQSGNEDRFAIIFDAGDPLGASCAKMCHSDARHRTHSGNADVWHWKAHRTNPIGLADDKWWSPSGRGSDAKTVSAYSDNKNTTGDAPLYSGPITDGHFIIIPKGGSVNDLEMSVETTNSYPGYILNANAEGSSYDVLTKGVFDETTGTWTLEFKRAFDTGNADDVVFSTNSTINFTTATFDNTGGGHASQGIDVGVYTLEIGDPVTAIGDKENTVPSNYRLGQNYPNPFNPVTTISFDLRSNSLVTIELFNTLGQKIRTLSEKQLAAGSYDILIDGAGLASGVYYYKMSVKELGSNAILFENTRKMVLMK